MGQLYRRNQSPLMVFRPAILALSKTLFAVAAQAAPTSFKILEKLHDGNEEEETTEVWILYLASIFLVLLGGAFAGLTIALMGQDSIYLQVILKDPTDPQQRNAKRVFQLLEKGKHWVLVTLLLSNVIVNETLPVVLDRCLGGGVAAVVGSTVLIVIFGEVVPQSVCVRYGLAIGGYMSGPVLLLMYLMAPLAWPTAKLLDWALGEDHGTVYKKSGLKTLVTLHRTLGEASERLNEDEVTIIGAVLDLKGKPVHAVMTPMDDVFVMSEDKVLDQEMIDMILSAGYSRIPIHEASNPTNYIGMLLVKILITYDPEDCKKVRDFPLATLPETRPETSCLDIINFFQEGKSHMVLVSESPGDDHGALGVVTLEDVIEELIGEEIIDESDVYIDVHKAIRRMAPAPKARYQRRLSQGGKAAPDAVESKSSDDTKIGEEEDLENENIRKTSYAGNSEARDRSGSPAAATVLLRRSSAGLDGRMENVPVRASFDDIKQHLKHLGPSNPASNPKATRSTTVKIKPRHQQDQSQPNPVTERVILDVPQDIEEEEGDETTSLLRGKLTPKDGTHALAQTYGAAGTGATLSRSVESAKPANPLIRTDDTAEHATQTSAHPSTTDLPKAATTPFPELQTARSSPGGSDHSPTDSLGPYGHKRGLFARSGSITEQVVETRTGIKKTILETTSSNDEDEDSLHHQSASRSTLSLPATTVLEGNGHDEAASRSAAGTTEGDATAEDQQNGGGNNGGKKKNRRKKRKGKS